MLNEELRQEITAMRDEDMRARAELLAANELGGAPIEGRGNGTLLP